MIGIFDSGFGGLTILKDIAEKLPQYQYLYLGDSARTPYGNRSQEAVYEFTRQGMDFLFSRGAQLIILACNTASALALRKLQQEYLPKEFSKGEQKNILGVIRPQAEAAIHITKNKRIGILGTRGVVRSKSFEIELKKLDSRVRVFQQAAPLLVPLIEEGWMKKPEARMILKKYLRQLKMDNVDTLVLGCTHYPVWQTYIERVMGRNCTVLDSPKVVAESLADYLNRHPEIEERIKKTSKEKREVQFFTTDDPQRFNELGSRFFKSSVRARRVRID